ncbi:transposase [Flavobacterium covae]|uniref:transposase n=1 Tax=Flavobacterium covae TaxID=2906076 RepID=UPI001FB6B2E4|nr:transposase [Flavobacterium covae]MCJ1805739.1 transposase [Flavobacterium covae]
MKYNPYIHHRKSIRLKGYDYSQAGLYFITLCCEDRAPLFGHIENGKMILNSFGEIALTEWYHTEQVRDNCVIHESVVMPNHMHGIIEITQKKGTEDEIGKFQSPSQTIGSIIRGYKIATIKKIKDLILENNKDIISTGESQFAPNKGELNSASNIGELDFPSNKGELDFASNKGELDFASNKGELDFALSTGELQFAPTEFAPTAPTAPTAEIIKSLDFKIWQRNYWEHIIRNENAYHRISNYIINNPQKWENDKLKK